MDVGREEGWDVHDASALGKGSIGRVVYGKSTLPTLGLYPRFFFDFQRKCSPSSRLARPPARSASPRPSTARPLASSRISTSSLISNQEEGVCISMFVTVVSGNVR